MWLTSKSSKLVEMSIMITMISKRMEEMTIMMRMKHMLTLTLLYHHFQYPHQYHKLMMYHHLHHFLTSAVIIQQDVLNKIIVKIQKWNDQAKR